MIGNLAAFYVVWRAWRDRPRRPRAYPVLVKVTVVYDGDGEGLVVTGADIDHEIRSFMGRAFQRA